MSHSWNDSTTGSLLGRDPGRTLRCWTAGFLRVGIGLSLLSTGLNEYFSQKGPGGGNGWNQGPMFVGFDPLISTIPYFTIALGMALTLGFLTTPSSIIAAFFSLLTPVFAILSALTMMGNSIPNRGMGPFAGIIMGSSLMTLLPYAALIWLSSLENHPISIDALIFGRNQFDPASPPGARVDAQAEPEVLGKIDTDQSSG